MANDSDGNQAADTLLADLGVLKRRVDALAVHQLAALDVFNLHRDIAALERLREGETVVVGGFNLDVPDAALIRDGTARSSLASTATCVRSLLLNADAVPGRLDTSPVVDLVVARFEGGQLTTRGLEHLNAFTVGQLLPLLRRLTDDVSKVGVLVRAATDALVGELEEGVSMPVAQGVPERFPAHGYLSYWALAALQDWGRFDPDVAHSCILWSEKELYKQVSLIESVHDERLDPYQLGYNLILQYRFNRLGFGDALIEVALRALFRAQLPRGVWEKRNPLFRYGQHGDAYCYAFEFLATLLSTLRGDDWRFLIPHRASLVSALEWAERNAQKPDQNGPPLWRSGHVIENDSPESWATAEVFSFLRLFSQFLSWHMQRVVLQEFRSTKPPRPNPQAFIGLYEPAVRLGDDSPRMSDFLREKMLDPLRQVDGTFSLARHSGAMSATRSGILFGPPGTGKTTFAVRTAAYLGWPLVSLDPSTFATQGLPWLATVAGRVFAKLSELEDVVIFFDEMEPLVRKREGGDATFEEKFLTTTLLPKLQGLHDVAKSIFLVATNRLGDIDPAILRPGRFDFGVLVMPPSQPETYRMIRESLGDVIYDRLRGPIEHQNHAKTLRLASRPELRRLVSQLRACLTPLEAEQLLGGFAAALVNDAIDWDEEEKKNWFVA